MVGDAGVGKSSLCGALTGKRFDSGYEMTIGVEFSVFRFVHEDVHLKLCLWDASGSRTFRSITRSYFAGAAVVYLVVDLSRHNIAQSVRTWAEEIRSAAPHAEVVLVGNKCDIAANRMDMLSLQQQYGFCASRETSAKTGSQVKEAFQQGVLEVNRKIREGQLPIGVTPFRHPIPRTAKEKSGLFHCCLTQ